MEDQVALKQIFFLCTLVFPCQYRSAGVPYLFIYMLLLPARQTDED